MLKLSYAFLKLSLLFKTHSQDKPAWKLSNNNISKRYVSSFEIRKIFEEELLNVKNKTLNDCVIQTKNRIEELELELMKKDIEIARLKKGYKVKGVGQEKEFVTTFNKNTK